jgi:hypothetical protein
MQHASIYCHPCIAPMKAMKQKSPMWFYRESPGKTPLPLDDTHQYLLQYKFTVKCYNHIWYIAMPFCFHKVYTQLPTIFSCIIQILYIDNTMPIK